MENGVWCGHQNKQNLLCFSLLQDSGPFSFEIADQALIEGTVLTNQRVLKISRVTALVERKVWCENLFHTESLTLRLLILKP